MINLRIKLARFFWKLSIKLTPPVEHTEAYKTLPEELKQSTDAAVEVDSPPEQWQPEQHGNSVIVEPDLMFRYRRGKL